MALKEMWLRDDDFPERHPVFDELSGWPTPELRTPSGGVITMAGYNALTGGRQLEFGLRGQYGQIGSN